MTVRFRWRGHETVMSSGIKVYADTRQPLSENPERQCGHCNLPNREDRHDACIGVLPGVVAACCGHGEDGIGFVQHKTLWWRLKRLFNKLTFFNKRWAAWQLEAAWKQLKDKQ